MGVVARIVYIQGFSKHVLQCS
jgi:hypothetical protein